MSEASLPHPLVAHVEPIVGESLLSLISRSCRANVFTHPADLLWEAGVEGTAAFAPFTAAQHADRIAAILGVPPGEVVDRMHSPVEGDVDRTLVWWSGVKMERRFLEARRRRVAPAALAISPHHRLSWMHRALAYCPETFQALISICARCGQPLGWTRSCGPDRCEHCRAWLRDLDAPFAPDDLRPSLAALGRLIDPDLSNRLAGVEALPAPFNTWDPGDVFSAICEFGAAWEHPSATGRSAAGRLLSEGQLESLSPALLSRGYDVIVGWPQSFHGLIERTWAALYAADPEASASLRRLGLLGRHIDGRLPATPLRRLIRERLGPAAQGAGVPLKIARALTLPDSPEELTLTQAQDHFGVTKATLGRLVPDGACCRRGRLGRGRAVRIDGVCLAVSVLAYKDGIQACEVGAILGVPSYMIGAFADAGFFSRIDDPDALLLAAKPELYSGTGVRAFEAKVRKSADADFGWPHTLSQALARRFSPEVWVNVFQGALDGSVRLSQVGDVAMTPFRPMLRPLADDLYVDIELCDQRIARVRKRPIPDRVFLTAQETARLLGEPPIGAVELIEAGAFIARRVGRSYRIGLHEVVRFSRTYMLVAEFCDRSHIDRRAVKHRRLAPDWDFETRHTKAVRRTVVEGVYFPRNSRKEKSN